MTTEEADKIYAKMFGEPPDAAERERGYPHLKQAHKRIELILDLIKEADDILERLREDELPMLVNLN